jgi:hypothetical protein
MRIMLITFVIVGGVRVGRKEVLGQNRAPPFLDVPSEGTVRWIFDSCDITVQYSNACTYLPGNYLN